MGCMKQEISDGFGNKTLISNNTSNQVKNKAKITLNCKWLM